MRRQHLVIMLKEPRPGQVKTRLGRDIGMTAAAWWFRHQACALIRRLEDPRWEITLAVSPDRAGLASRCWPMHLRRIPQGPGTVGDRMARVFRRMPRGPVLIVGADIPAIEPHHIARAFRAVACQDSVLGPATDGGYWLIGLKRTAPLPVGLLRDVRWSTCHALADTLRSLRPLRTAQVDTLSDVDTASDLEMHL